MMKGLKQIALAYLCLLPLGSATVSAKIEPLDRVIAVVDKDVITQSELDTRIGAVERQLSDRGIARPSASVLKKQVLEQLILENIQLQLGERGGIRIDDWTLNDAISRIAERNKMTLDEFRQSIEADGMSFAEARNEIRRELVISRVRNRQVGQRIQVSEQEIDNFLSSPEGQAQLQIEFRLGHILIPTPDNPSPEQIRKTKKQAQEIYQKIRKGASFQEMAVAWSKGQNALNGGDLGWRKADQLPTLFAEQAVKMKTGDLSEPVRSPAGFHIFKLLETRGDNKVLQDQVRVRHILIKPNEIRSDLEAQMLAKKLYNRVNAGEQFSELAKAYSNDTTSALNGGDMDWMSPATLVPEFQAAMKQVPENIVSKPFRTTYGWHILEVLGRRKSDISDEVRRNRVRELLSNRKFEEELQVWLREIRDQAYVEIKN